MDFLVAVLALGVAGLHPGSTLMLGASLLSGTGRRAAVGFVLANAVTTMGLGIGLSLVLGPRLTPLDVSFDVVPKTDWAVVNMVLVTVLVAWGLRRATRPRHGARPGRTPRTVSSRRMSVTGAVFGATALVDPAFYAVVVLAGRGNPLWDVVAAHVLWYAVSQSPLLVLLGSVLAGRPEALISRAQRLWRTWRRGFDRLVTATIFLAAAFLLVDTLHYALTGAFLIG